MIGSLPLSSFMKHSCRIWHDGFLRELFGHSTLKQIDLFLITQVFGSNISEILKCFSFLERFLEQILVLIVSITSAIIGKTMIWFLYSILLTLLTKTSTKTFQTCCCCSFFLSGEWKPENVNFVNHRVRATPWSLWKALEFNFGLQGRLKSPWQKGSCWKLLEDSLNFCLGVNEIASC